ncbi:MAG: UDP-N-acetylmuramate dehydrogenase [Oscillospiraceae bacterium]
MPYITNIINLCDTANCKYLLDEPLKNHTTFKVGGNCKIFVEVNSVDLICKLIRFCKDNQVKFTVMGNGSNIIAKDSGFDGVVIHLGSELSSLQMLSDTEIKAYSGTSLKSLCLMALDNHLTGLEFAYGIPGSVGGALYMNAGAYGGEMVNIVKSAEYINSDGELKTISVEDMQFSYRCSIFSKLDSCVIVSVTVQGTKGIYEDIKSEMDRLMTARKSKQPLEFPSAGSTFKRPVGDYASRLIDVCGLRGLSVGDAQVSEKHCGFIINKGNATCDDILKLTDKVIQIVKEKTGYTLELEPKILG